MSVADVASRLTRRSRSNFYYAFLALPRPRRQALYAVYDPHERKRWVDLADELGLVCTAGSDWHGPDDAGAQLGVDVDGDRGARLHDWLFAG